LIQSDEFDLVHIDHILLYQYAKCFSGIPFLQNHHSMENIAQKRLLDGSGNYNYGAQLYRKLEIWRWKQYEFAPSQRSDVITVISGSDAQFFSHYLPYRKIFVVPNGVDVQMLRPKEEIGHSQIRLSTGSMNYAPNEDAFLWFAQEIFPEFQVQFPQIQFIIAGRDLTPKIIALSKNPAVTVTDFVQDIQPF
jgi:polysaccharide biosynthesis protein PslH